MPFSNSEQISPILSEIKHFQPKTILDVGCGLGVYGFLCRIYLDLYDDVNFFEKLKNRKNKQWDITIDAIEGFEEYLPFIPRWAYDNVLVGNVLNILTTIEDKKYDLILALAIIEHLTKEEGKVFIKEMRRVSKQIILSVPKEWKEQVVPDNPFETHKSHWTDSELRESGFNKFLPHWGAWIAIYDPELEEALRRRKVSEKIPEPSIPKRAVAPRTSGSLESKIKQVEEIQTAVKNLENKMNTIIDVQGVILERLNVSTRFRNLLRKFKGMFT